MLVAETTTLEGTQSTVRNITNGVTGRLVVVNKKQRLGAVEN